MYKKNGSSLYNLVIVPNKNKKKESKRTEEVSKVTEETTRTTNYAEPFLLQLRLCLHWLFLHLADVCCWTEFAHAEHEAIQWKNRK